jgi:import inner membrane translocase subunit TIM50
MGTPDVRTAIASFEGEHIPTEFARRDAISRAKFQAQLSEERKKSPKVSGLGALSGMLGIKGGMTTMDGQQRPGEGFLQGKMLQDLAREDAIKNYQALDKEIRENGEKWLKEEALNEKMAQQEGMKAMKSGFSGWFGGPSDSK